MTPQFYQPEGDPVPHKITAELVSEIGWGLLYLVRSDGEEIGEVDVDIAGEHSAFISGIGPGDKINNGYFKPASLVIGSCLKDRDPDFKTLYDFNNEPLELSS